MFTTVEQQTVAIIQRFGKHQTIAGPGFHWLMPFADTVVARLDLRINELTVRVESKTKDNVFVFMSIAVQFAVKDPYDAYYKLSNPRAQIESYVFDVVRARVPKLKLDQAFESKDDIADVVRSQLSDIMEEFGYTIVKALVTDIEPAAEVKDSMNRISAAERLKVAAELEAEADKIRMVKAAEAEAESKHLQGLGIARQRKAIADGLAESAEMVQDNVDGMSAEAVMSLLMLTQYFDTLQTMAENADSRVIFLPHSPAGMTDIAEQIQRSVVVGNEAKGPSPAMAAK